MYWISIYSTYFIKSLIYIKFRRQAKFFSSKIFFFIYNYHSVYIWDNGSNEIVQKIVLNTETNDVKEQCIVHVLGNTKLTINCVLIEIIIKYP
jgi:hypothetical protein